MSVAICDPARHGQFPAGQHSNDQEHWRQGGAALTGAFKPEPNEAPAPP
jgi:hypothetical protein